MTQHTSEALNIFEQVGEILRDRMFWLFKDIVEDDPARQELYRILGPYSDHRVINGRAYYHLPGAEKIRICEILTLDDTGTAHDLSIRFLDSAEELSHLRDIAFIKSWEHRWEGRPNSTYYYDPVDIVCVYISEKDIFHGGKTVYRVGFPYAQSDLDLRVSCPSLFINAEVNDGSEIATLMQKVTGRASGCSESDPISARMALTNAPFSQEVPDYDYIRLCKTAFDLLSPLYHYELYDLIAQLDISQILHDWLQAMKEGVFNDLWRET